LRARSVEIVEDLLGAQGVIAAAREAKTRAGRRFRYSDMVPPAKTDGELERPAAGSSFEVWA
jgi:hypothetical protein